MANIVLAASDLQKSLLPAAASTRAVYMKHRKPWTYGYALRAETTGTGLLVGVSFPADGDITKRNVLQGQGTTPATTAITAGITNTSTTVVYAAATATFPLVGAAVTGTGIPASTTVATVTAGVGFTISQAATATNASASLTIGISGVLYTLPTGTGITLPLTTDITEASNYANAVLLAYAPGDRSNAVIVPRIATNAAIPTGPWWRTETTTVFSTAASGAAGSGTDWAAGYVLDLIVPAAGDISTLFDQASTAGPVIISSRGLMVAGGSGKTGNIFLTRAYR